MTSGDLPLAPRPLRGTRASAMHVNKELDDALASGDAGALMDAVPGGQGVARRR